MKRQSKEILNLNRRAFLKASRAFLGGALLSMLSRTRVASGSPDVFWRGNSEVASISLTFDDCYLLYALQTLEKLLEENPKVKITFFPVGIGLINTTAKDPEIWTRLMKRGHEIGYHSYDHTLPSLLSKLEMKLDYERWWEVVVQILGEEPQVRFARPPYGELSESFLQLCGDKNLIPVMWSTSWGKTFTAMQPEVSILRQGEIVLLHVREPDVGNLLVAIPFLEESRLHMVTLSDLYVGNFEDQSDPKMAKYSPQQRFSRTYIR